jgi:hydroxymethylpyrimidine kinase/phosphomethylpyrimidine kinase
MAESADRGRPGVPRVLTVAGSDSGGGAGIQADLKTIFALGGYGMSAVTALTAQNTVGVLGIRQVAPEFVALQIDAVVEDIGVDAAKTGMLGSREVVEVVAERIGRHGIRRLVVDPVIVATSGDVLATADAREATRTTLLPLSVVVTPNLTEAAALADAKTPGREAMREVARRIHDLGPDWVLLKGGHLEGPPVDLLYDGRDFTEIVRPRIRTKNTHGTGCTYSAAIATGLARGMPVPEAVVWARDALQAAIERSLPLGQGHGPVDHRAMLESSKPPPGHEDG